MTYEEALRTSYLMLKEHPWGEEPSLGSMIIKDFIERSQPALAKQVPMKPNTIKKPFANFYVCPGCGKHLLRTWVNYCEKCGQRLDWSEEK